MAAWVYIMTNERHTVLYVGVTSILEQRVYDHKAKKFPNSFTARYNIAKLVYCEEHSDIRNAIAREKVIKGGSRTRKIALINSKNPEWESLIP